MIAEIIGPMGRPIPSRIEAKTQADEVGRQCADKDERFSYPAAYGAMCSIYDDAYTVIQRQAEEIERLKKEIHGLYRECEQ